MGNGLSRRQSRAAISSRALCRRLNCGRHFLFPPAHIDRPWSSRARVQAVEQKNGAEKCHCDCHLRRGHCGGVRLYASRAYPDRDAGTDVFPARTRHREIRALDLVWDRITALNAEISNEIRNPASPSRTGRIRMSAASRCFLRSWLIHRLRRFSQIVLNLC